MIFDLCIGGNEVFWEFKDEQHRNIVWTNLQKNHGWQPEWAVRRGEGKQSARYHIIFNLSAMPISYRWHCVFDWEGLAEQENLLREFLRMVKDGDIHPTDFRDPAVADRFIERIQNLFQ